MINRSTIEEKRFGITCGRISVENVEQVNPLCTQADKEGFKFISTRVTTEKIQLAQQLEANGFYLTDTLLSFKRKTIEKTYEDWRSCLGNERAEEEVLQLAKKSFTNYMGHYMADPYLDKAAVEEIYPDWAQRCISDRNTATEVIVSYEEEVLSGFISLKVNGDSSEVVLAAVDPDFQGKYVLQGLLRSAVSWAFANGVKEIVYSTQIHNIAAQRALSRQGWELSHSFYTFHRWNKS